MSVTDPLTSNYYIIGHWQEQQEPRPGRHPYPKLPEKVKFYFSGEFN
jgi:hypothetical protein